jgi:hypothetical protein
VCFLFCGLFVYSPNSPFPSVSIVLSIPFFVVVAIIIVTTSRFILETVVLLDTAAAISANATAATTNAAEFAMRAFATGNQHVVPRRSPTTTGRQRAGTGPSLLETADPIDGNHGRPQLHLGVERFQPLRSAL